MTVSADCVLFSPSLGMPKKECPVQHPGLLSECQGVSLTVGCVSEQVPCASGETERADIGACFVPGVVLGFALCESDVPRFR